jgi:hypothetical protein
MEIKAESGQWWAHKSWRRNAFEFGEHCFRFSPSFDKHVIDLMKRTQVAGTTGHSVDQWLRPTTESAIAMVDDNTWYCFYRRRHREYDRLRRALLVVRPGRTQFICTKRHPRIGSANPLYWAFQEQRSKNIRSRVQFAGHYAPGCVPWI